MGRSEQVRADVTFRGTVQGVGFRYTARRVASGFAVTGFVRNEPDGSVTLVAEGPRDEVESFIDAVQREMAGTIRDTDVAWGAATGQYDGFGVHFSW